MVLHHKSTVKFTLRYTHNCACTRTLLSTVLVYMTEVLLNSGPLFGSFGVCPSLDESSSLPGLSLHQHHPISPTALY